MAKKIKLEITEAQLIALIEVVDESSAMIGCDEDGDSDKIRIKRIKLLDKMLNNNGYKREFL